MFTKLMMFGCVLLGAAFAASGGLASYGPDTMRPKAESRALSEKPIRLAITCFKAGESISGINKICMYNCAGSSAAITVAAHELCPVSIER